MATQLRVQDGRFFFRDSWVKDDGCLWTEFREAGGYVEGRNIGFRHVSTCLDAVTAAMLAAGCSEAYERKVWESKECAKRRSVKQ